MWKCIDGLLKSILLRIAVFGEVMIPLLVYLGISLYLKNKLDFQAITLLVAWILIHLASLGFTVNDYRKCVKSKNFERVNNIRNDIFDSNLWLWTLVIFTLIATFFEYNCHFRFWPSFFIAFSISMVLYSIGTILL